MPTNHPQSTPPISISRHQESELDPQLVESLRTVNFGEDWTRLKVCGEATSKCEVPLNYIFTHKVYIVSKIVRLFEIYMLSVQQWRTEKDYQCGILECICRSALLSTKE